MRTSVYEYEVWGFHRGDFLYYLLCYDCVQSGRLVSKLSEERIISVFRVEAHYESVEVIVIMVAHGVTFSGIYICSLIEINVRTS
jgi:hypothetical protein